MGFETAVNAMVNGAISNATLLLSDFKGVIALFVGVTVLGVIVGWFLTR
ncbi:MAG: hypothetical protein U1E26_12805 [Coriobacteriia bacterium]|nr:hypothetical protein [Coriobacteriia bacterium]